MALAPHDVQLNISSGRAIIRKSATTSHCKQNQTCELCRHLSMKKRLSFLPIISVCGRYLTPGSCGVLFSSLSQIVNFHGNKLAGVFGRCSNEVYYVSSKRK